MSETMVERVAKAIDAVQIWSRFNDWTSDKVEGLPIEICRYAIGGKTTDDIEILKRFPVSNSVDDALREVVSEMRARAAVEAMREHPPQNMILAGYQALMDWDARTGEDHGIFEVWQAMISAALSPSTRGE